FATHALPVLVGAVAFLQTGAPARAMPTGGDATQLREAAIALDELRIEDAEPALTRLAATHPHDPDVLWERAMLRFVRGDYAGAKRDAARSVVRATGLRSPAERVEIYRLIAATHEATRHYVEERS